MKLVSDGMLVAGRGRGGRRESRRKIESTYFITIVINTTRK